MVSSFPGFFVVEGVFSSFGRTTFWGGPLGIWISKDCVSAVEAKNFPVGIAGLTFDSLVGASLVPTGVNNRSVLGFLSPKTDLKGRKFPFTWVLALSSSIFVS